MTRWHFVTMATAVALLVALTGALGAQQGAADVALRAAMELETVRGDLKGAIQAYQKIAETHRDNRAVAAQALLQMAGVYRMLGDPADREVYERLIREYADQKEATALAQTRLGGTERPVGIALRKVWTSQGVDILGAISPDGRRLSYTEREHGHLMLRDLVDGTDRLLTHEPDNYYYVFGSRMSKDGTQIAYSWNIPRSQRHMLCIASLQGNGLLSPRLLFDNEEIIEVAPADWSPDGGSIAVVVERRDRTHQIALVSVRDGSLRVLKSLDWRSPSAMFFSPDGRDLAFDLPVGDTDANRDVFVMAVDASREIPAVEHPSRDILMGWSPDGTQLLFASDRSSGSMGLWTLAIAERRPAGLPTLIKPDIGNTQSLGVTSAGKLYLASNVTNSDIEVASIDFGTGRAIDRSVRPIQGFVGSNRTPAWSADGEYLAYISQRQTHLVLGIRSMTTGSVQELRPALRYINSLSWAPDGRSFAVAGADVRGRQGVYRVDAQSGEAVPIVLTPTGTLNVSYMPQWSPDGTRLYYRRNIGEGRAVFERELSSGRERELARGSLGVFRVSPDGRWIATTNQWAPTTRSVVLLMPVEGGVTRELLEVNKSVNDPGPLGVQSWTSDSRGVIVRKSLADSGDGGELWVVPLSGAAPRKLDFDVSHIPNTNQPFSVHPDGRRLALQTGQRTHEVWALENFLPTPTSTR